MAVLYSSGVFENGVRFISTLPEANDFTLSYRMIGLVVQIAVTVKSLSTEEKGIEFMHSALDVSGLESNNKAELDEAISKYEAEFLNA